MSRREKFSIRKSHRGAISTCIAVLGLFSLAGLGQEAKAEELVLTSADTSLVEADAFTTSEQEETSLELTTLSAPVEEEVAVTGTETIQEVEAQLDQVKEEVAQAGQSLEEAEAAQAQAKSDLDQAQAALDAVETSRTETRQVGTKTETVQTGTKTETVQTGTRTDQVQVGTTTENKVQRVTEQVQVGTRTEQVQTGTKTEQVQTGSRFETQTVGEETQTITTGYRTEQVQVGEETVTEGGNSTLKAGTMTYAGYGENEGIIVTDAYLTAIKNLANGTGTADDVRRAIREGDEIFGLALHRFLGNSDLASFASFYETHQYELANSDRTTKYDVFDLPYEVRKDLSLFYAALVNDVRAKVGTEPLKVTEKSVQDAYNTVTKLLRETYYIPGQDKKNSMGVSNPENFLKKYETRQQLEESGLLQTARFTYDPDTVSQYTSSSSYIKSLEYTGDLLGMSYANFQNTQALFGDNGGLDARYQTIDHLKYGILTMVGQQLFGISGRGSVGSAKGGLNGEQFSNFEVATRILGLDASKNNTVGLDISLYEVENLAFVIGDESEAMFVFSESTDSAIANPYQDTTGGTTKVVPIYETRQVPITETRVVPITKQVEVPVYSTIETPIYETREVPIYEDKTSIKVVPVETPVYESRQVPVYETIETPIYEEVETPVYETVEVAVAVPQNLLDALSQAKANYDTAQAQTQQARESYKVAQDRLAEVQAKLADLQTPAVEEVPSPTETPAVEEVPSPTETPVVEEVPSPTETPAVEETPSPTEAPVTEDSPAPVEKPTRPTEDKVEPSPAGGAAAAAGQDKPVTSRLTGIGSSERPVITATASGSGYSRVARSTAEKTLPNTGDAGSVAGLIGTALTSLGLVGLKRKRG